MAFYDMTFPTMLKVGSKGGRRWAVDVYENALSGAEQRNLYHSNGRRTFILEKGSVNDAQKEELVAFWNIMKGKAHSFYYQEGPTAEFESTDSASELVPVRFNMDTFEPEAAAPGVWNIPEIELIEVIGEDT